MDVSTFTAQRKTVTTRTGDVACTEFGAGPAALFIHGIGTSGATWRHVIEQLAGTTRCIAIDLPAHGGTPAGGDLSVAALAALTRDLADALGLDQFDLVGADTGGAVAQIFAARNPARLRTLALTNCDTDGNFPPPEFAPIIETARQHQLADALVAITGDPAAWRTSPLAAGYEHPELIPDDAWREYLMPTDAIAERARDFERLLAALDPADLTAVAGELRDLRVPTLIVWGTGDAAFGVEWAYKLRDSIGGAPEVIEVPGAKTFFAEERPGDLVPRLRAHWGR